MLKKHTSAAGSFLPPNTEAETEEAAVGLLVGYHAFVGYQGSVGILPVNEANRLQQMTAEMLYMHRLVQVIKEKENVWGVYWNV